MSRRATSASALLLVLWCVAVLSITILAVARMVQADVDESGLKNRRLEARELAMTGVAYGLHPKIDPWDPLLDEKLANGDRLRVREISEAARIDINAALKESRQATLRALFRNWGLDVDQISIVVDSLLDWTDPDNLPKLNGAERDSLERQTQYSLPANRDFRSVTEMEKVRGMDLVAAAKPNWADFFTVYGGRRLDLQDASIDVLRAAGGLSEDQAEMIDRVRRGPDGIAQTKDDFKIRNVGEFLEKVGLPELQAQTVAARFSAGMGPTRIQSTAKVGGTEYRIVAIAARGSGGGSSVLVQWEEQ
jgi:type II secretory pathway component PulK